VSSPDQINLAKRFLNEDRIDEALYFIWLAAENLVNTLKVAINGFYVKDHREKGLILKEYYILGFLARIILKSLKSLQSLELRLSFILYSKKLYQKRCSKLS